MRSQNQIGASLTAEQSSPCHAKWQSLRDAVANSQREARFEILQTTMLLKIIFAVSLFAQIGSTSIAATLPTSNPDVVTHKSESVEEPTSDPTHLRRSRPLTYNFAEFSHLRIADRIFYLQGLRVAILEVERARYQKFHSKTARISHETASVISAISAEFSRKFHFLSLIVPVLELDPRVAFAIPAWKEGEICFFAGWPGKADEHGECKVNARDARALDDGRFYNCRSEIYGVVRIRKTPELNQDLVNTQCDLKAQPAEKVVEGLTKRSVWEKVGFGTASPVKRHEEAVERWNKMAEQIDSSCRGNEAESACKTIRTRLYFVGSKLDSKISSTPPSLASASAAPLGAASARAADDTLHPGSGDGEPQPVIASGVILSPSAPAVEANTPGIGGGRSPASEGALDSKHDPNSLFFEGPAAAVPARAPVVRGTTPAPAPATVPAAETPTRDPNDPMGTEAAPSTTPETPTARRARRRAEARQAREEARKRAAQLAADGSGTGSGNAAPSAASPGSGSGTADPSPRTTRRRRTRRAPLQGNPPAAGSGQRRGADTGTPQSGAQTNVVELQDRGPDDDAGVAAANREAGRAAADGRCEPLLLLATLSLPCDDQRHNPHPEVCQGSVESNLVLEIGVAKDMVCGNPPRIQDAKIDESRQKMARVLSLVKYLPKHDQGYWTTHIRNLQKNLESCIGYSKLRTENKHHMSTNPRDRISVEYRGSLTKISGGRVRSYDGISHEVDFDGRRKSETQVHRDSGPAEPAISNINDVWQALDYRQANLCDIVLSGSESAASTFNGDGNSPSRQEIYDNMMKNMTPEDRQRELQQNPRGGAR